MSRERVLLRPSTTPIQVRFSDTDMMGHISGVSYAAYTEVGRTSFFSRIAENEVGQEVPWFVMVHLSMDFKSEGTFDSIVEITTRCEKIGQKSLTLAQDIMANGRLVTAAKAVLCGFDRKTRGSIAIPSHWAIE
jgi:acyl-CoA thioester hydrolase